MKKFLLTAFVALGLASIGHAQAPAGSTGQCKDGTYTSAKSKRGACSGHGGVQTWMGDTSPTPSTAKSTPTASTPVSRPATPDAVANKAVPATPATAAPTAAQGGRPEMVWVNLPTKIYHCPGTRYYGTTKSGKYMSEADAKAMGARGDHNKTCTQ